MSNLQTVWFIKTVTITFQCNKMDDVIRVITWIPKTDPEGHRAFLSVSVKNKAQWGHSSVIFSRQQAFSHTKVTETHPGGWGRSTSSSLEEGLQRALLSLFRMHCGQCARYKTTSWFHHAAISLQIPARLQQFVIPVLRHGPGGGGHIVIIFFWGGGGVVT